MQSYLVNVYCISSTLWYDIQNPIVWRYSTIHFLLVFAWMKKYIKSGSKGSFNLNDKWEEW